MRRKNDVFEVEKIIDEKMVRGVKTYLIKWARYTEQTWEPEANLGCEEVLLEYELSKKHKPVARIALLKPKQMSMISQSRAETNITLRRTPYRTTFQPGTLYQAEWIELLILTRMSIHIHNSMDESGPPSGLSWKEDIALHKDVPLLDLASTRGCFCELDCSEDTPETCSCSATQGHPAYNSKGLIIRPASPHGIFECNLICSCNLTCLNRVTQRESKITFEILRTALKGWGVRTLTALSKGQFVSKYIGEIITVREAKKRKNHTYMFDIDCFGTKRAQYVIDAIADCNISRFYNHSCDPNMAAYLLYVDTVDPLRHEIAFFTTREVDEGEELTFDYGAFRKVPRQRIEPVLECLCGSAKCKNWVPLFTETVHV